MLYEPRASDCLVLAHPNKAARPLLRDTCGNQNRSARRPGDLLIPASRRPGMDHRLAILSSPRGCHCTSIFPLRRGTATTSQRRSALRIRALSRSRRMEFAAPPPPFWSSALPCCPPIMPALVNVKQEPGPSAAAYPHFRVARGSVDGRGVIRVVVRLAFSRGSPR